MQSSTDMYKYRIIAQTLSGYCNKKEHNYNLIKVISLYLFVRLAKLGLYEKSQYKIFQLVHYNVVVVFFYSYGLRWGQNDICLR